MLLIHGENISQSRNFLNLQIKDSKDKKQEILKLNGRNLKLEELQEALQCQSLFEKEKLIIIENLFSRPKEEIIDYLNQKTPKNLIAWEQKELFSTQTKKIKADIKIFKLPPIIFDLLDSLLPQNYKKSIFLLHQVLKETSAEQVFYLLIKQIRYLIIAHQLGEKALKGIHPYQAKKIANQTKKFNLKSLLLAHKTLVSIDYRQKTGKAAVDLSFHLDLFLGSL